MTTPGRPTKAPAPGIYPDVPFAEYARWDAWNQSTLKCIGAYDSVTGHCEPAPWASPAHARAHLDGLEETTDSQRVGSDYHALLLEPARFNREYHVLQEKCDRRTTEGKARWARLAETFGEDRILTKERWEQLLGMARAASRNPHIKNLVGAKAEHEVSMVWNDEETGLLCKARLDILITAPSGKVYIPDIKSTRCAHWRMFERDAARFAYHVQAAMYHDGYTAAAGKPPDDYLLIAQETAAPYPAVIYRVRPEELDSGRRHYRAQLQLASECAAKNSWPAYADDRIVDLVLPAWAHADEPESIA